MQFLTNFGDEFVVLPLAAATFIWLAAVAGRRAAVMWCSAVLVCGGATALLKIYFGACTAMLGSLSSPSGHTSMSTLVYGSLALIVGVEHFAWQRIAAVLLGATLVFGIALSRILVGAHTAIEVVIGLVIGGAALALFARGYLTVRPARPKVWVLVAAAMLLAAVLHGRTLELEPLWHALAGYLDDRAGLCRV